MTDAASALVELRRWLPTAVALRHRLHQEPDLGGAETRTVARLQEFLPGLDSAEIAGGLLVESGGRDRPAVGIRAELDALDIQETSEAGWASVRPGVAHLCGHDVHMAALAAVLQTAAHLDDVPRLVGVFQPREETSPSGAVDLIASGALENRRITAMLGFHVQPVMPRGVISAAPGVTNAAADSFEIRVNGRASHGAYPQLARDPIVASAALVQSLQHVISRRIDPMHPAVLSIGSVHGGTSANAIPESVTMTGTLRSYRDADRAALLEHLRRVVRGVATAHDCEIVVDIAGGEPALRNDDELAGRVTAALVEGGFSAGQAFRSCGADDFAYYGARLPTLMIFVGVGTAASTSPGLHHPAFVPDDEAVEDIATAMLLGLLAAPERLDTP